MSTPTHPAETATTFGTPPPLTMLDGLNADLDEHPALNDTVDLDIPTRQGWAVRCTTDIPYENLAAWRKSALDPAMASGTNELKLACSILIYTTQGLLVDGEPVTVNDQPVAFDSAALHEKLGVTRPADAVRKLFGRDGFVTAASTALLREAGYGSEATPTRR